MLCCMADFLTRLALVGVVALFAAWAVLANVQRVRAALDALADVPRWRLAAFLFFAAIATLSAQKRTLRGGGQQGTMSYSMPTNGVRYANWSLRGAYEDVFRLDLGGFSFPLGTSLCTSLWVYSWGMAGARLGDRTNRIVAVGAPMSAVPGLSQFWSADTDDGGKLRQKRGLPLRRHGPGNGCCFFLACRGALALIGGKTLKAGVIIQRVAGGGLGDEQRLMICCRKRTQVFFQP